MEDYYFRVKASDRVEMRRLLNALNVIKIRDGEIVPHRDGDSWVDIGRLDNWQNPNQFVKDPVSGEVYWHYNLRTAINVRRRIKDAVAEGNADAIALNSEKGRWYARVTNDDNDKPLMQKVVWL
jgi:hypothetical protein